MNSKQIWDITIVGGGPVGLAAAYYAGIRQAKTKLIESLEALGGQPAHLFPEKKIHDIFSQPEITGVELTEQMIKQAQTYQPTICLGEEALRIEEHTTTEGEKYFELKSTKSTHYTRTIIVAAGNGAFTPRQLTLPEATEYSGQSLHYYLNNIDRFKDRRVAVLGGGDSAVDWALMLEPLASEVHLIHRRPRFRAHESSIKQLEESSIQIYTPYIPKQIIGEQGQIRQLLIDQARVDDPHLLEIDDLVVSYGFHSSYGELNKWGMTMERGAIKVDPHYYMSSIPGIFAIGDSAYYEGKVKLIATGFGEVAQAVSGALIHIDPVANTAPIHSTTY